MKGPLVFIGVFSCGSDLLEVMGPGFPNQTLPIGPVVVPFGDYISDSQGTPEKEPPWSLWVQLYSGLRGNADGKHSRPYIHSLSALNPIRRKPPKP